jgi:hypothetical protein
MLSMSPAGGIVIRYDHEILTGEYARVALMPSAGPLMVACSRKAEISGRLHIFFPLEHDNPIGRDYLGVMIEYSPMAVKAGGKFSLGRKGVDSKILMLISMFAIDNPAELIRVLVRSYEIAEGPAMRPAKG